jgi:hypothetical protein
VNPIRLHLIYSICVSIASTNSKRRKISKMVIKDFSKEELERRYQFIKQPLYDKRDNHYYDSYKAGDIVRALEFLLTKMVYHQDVYDDKVIDALEELHSLIEDVFETREEEEWKERKEEKKNNEEND